MRRWFLSYNSQDLHLMQRLEAELKRKDPDAEIYFAPRSQRAGGYWVPMVADAIHEATIFVLLVGANGIGPWQRLEYCEALDRRVRSPDFPLVLLLLEGQSVPGLPFVRQLHWIVTEDPLAEKTLGRLMDAAAGGETQPLELWRHTAPYRGLAAMSEADSDFFFGRTRETVEVLRALAEASDRLPILIGNSGVGKSSVAQAGVLAALARQAWPSDSGTSAWPVVFRDSRRWCFLKLNPGAEPLKALVEPFLRTWQLDTTDPRWERRRSDWSDELLKGDASLRGLLDASERRYEELGQPKPEAFFLYVDQGEEIYVRAEDRQRRRFSDILAEGLGDPRLRALMSLRADFLGDLQQDASLYAVHHQINVPPMREAELREVVNRPAQLLSARFENEALAVDITTRTAEESIKDVGALPLLSYLLDDMWTQMVKRGDGVLRLPAQAVELGGVLAHRADAFLVHHAGAERDLQRLLTLKLATVRADGEPTRRRAVRSEFSDEEWRLVSELADHPYRLLVTATPEGQDAYAEVAHEAIFRRWEKLRGWLVAEREFLMWKGELEVDRRRWEQASEPSRSDALLMGLSLIQAQDWLAKRAEDLLPVDRQFIQLSIKHEALEQEQKERLRRRIQWLTLVALLLVTVGAVVVAIEWLDARQQRRLAEHGEQEAREQAIHARQQRDKALLTQSLFLANLAEQQYAGGNAVSGMLLALEALPDAQAGSERPYASEAEARLFSNAFLQRETMVLTGHQQAVPMASFSRDGKHILSASWDGTARVWSATTGRQTALLSGHKGEVRWAAFSRDGTKVVTVGKDKTARVWEASTGQQSAIFAEHTAEIVSAEFDMDGARVVTASEDKTARIWDASTGHQLTILDGHTGPLAHAVFSPDGKLVLTASSDKTACLWEARSGKQLRVLADHQDRVNDALFDADGGRVVTISDDKSARIYDTATGHAIAVLQGNDGKVYSVTFSADGKTVATAEGGGTAVVWEASTGNRLTTVGTHADLVFGVAFDRTSKLLVTASRDGTAGLWDLGKKSVVLLAGHNDMVRTASFSPDGRTVLTASNDGTIRLWSVAALLQPVPLLGHREAVASAAFNSAGTRVVTASDDHTARIWDAATGRELAVLEGHSDKLWGATFSPDGTRVATYSVDHTAHLWDAVSGTHIASLKGHLGPVVVASFSADSQKLVTSAYLGEKGAYDGIARIWNAVTGVEIGELRGHSGDVTSAAFSPDSARVATTSTDGTVRIWDVATSHEIMLLQSDHGKALSVAFNPAGTRLVTGYDDGAAWIWDAMTGREIVLLHDHTGPVSSVFFSSDGRRVLTSGDNFVGNASLDTTVRLWDVDSGSALSVASGLVDRTSNPFSPDLSRFVTASVGWIPYLMHRDTVARVWTPSARHTVAALTAHKDKVMSASFSADGRHIVTASQDGTAFIWPMFPTTQELIDYAKRHVPRCLTRKERERFFLAPEPPPWCIEMEKWPYDSQEWKNWLRNVKANATPALPDTPE